MADLDGLREEWFLRMLAPPPAAREISVEGARILADTYRDLVGAHHDRVLAAVGRSLAETQGVCSRACPLDLHALVPDAVLQLGPDDPAASIGFGPIGAPRGRCGTWRCCPPTTDGCAAPRRWAIASSARTGCHGGPCKRCACGPCLVLT